MRLIFIMCSFLFSGSVGADTLKICSTADWPPYEVMNPETKKVEGMSVDILTKVMQRMGMKVDIQQLPWERCLAMNKNGTLDGVISVSKNAEREQFLIYPNEDIFKASYAFVILKGTECKYCDTNTNLKDLPQPLGGPQGYSVVKKLKSAEPGLTIDDSAPSDEVNIDKLLAGRVKSIIINPDVLRALDKDNKIMPKLQILTPPYEAGKPYYIGVSKKYKGLEVEAQKLADKISGAIQKIRVK